MKHRSKGRRKAAVSTPSGGPVFVSPEEQKRMMLDKWHLISAMHNLLKLFRYT